MARQKSEKACRVEMTENLFSPENKTLVEVLKGFAGDETPRVVLIADQNIVVRQPKIGTAIGAYLKAHGIELAGKPVLLAGGERVKGDNFASASEVLSALLDGHLRACDAVLALGGGTILDVAGWAASQVRGGVRLVRIPTTPAAMIDAAFATTACLDSAHTKDALVVPSVPSAVIVDPCFAKSVLDAVWRAGMAEAVRLAAVNDGAFLKFLAANAEKFRSRDFETFSEIVARSVKLRQKKGAPAFGLWAAARLEAMSQYKLPHGYAVAIGICLDATYALKKEYIKEETRDSICGTIAACGGLDGLMHSHHLLSQPAQIAIGLDAWELATGSREIELPSGNGKSKVEEELDFEVYRAVLKEYVVFAQTDMRK